MPEQLGYRSQFDVPRDQAPHVESAVMASLRTWLLGKGYAADAMAIDREVQIGEDVTGRLLHVVDDQQGEAFQATIVESGSSVGTWTSQVTVHQPIEAEAPAQVLLDISGPFPPRTPKLARLLTAELPARDGSALLNAVPTMVRRADVGAVIGAVTDPERAGLLFVAGMNPDLPEAEWLTLVTKLLDQTTGLAAAYFLDAEATAIFRQAVGPDHAVAPGTVRTFQPHVDAEDPADALRHRVLGTERIVRDSGRRLASFLGRRAQEAALSAELPASLVPVLRSLRDRADEVWFENLDQSQDAFAVDTEQRTQEPAPADAAPEDVAEEATPAPETGVAGEPSDQSVGETRPEHVGAGWLVAARRALGRVFRNDDPEAADWDALADLATAGRTRATVLERLRGRVQALRGAADDAEFARLEVAEQLQDERLEHAIAQEELDRVARRNAHLESLLLKSELANDVFAEPPAEEPVADVLDMLARVADLERVEFTGDLDVVLSLDQHDNEGVWARKIWQIALVLEDYAQASVDGRCSTGVHLYLQSPPAGCLTWSANKHAATESDQVQQTPKLADERLLPVPVAVHESGRRHMMAHFKVAKFGRISPRLHYFDDTARTGKVYIGHIGPHLTTARS